MLTYHYELIYGVSWVPLSGSVDANSRDAAREKIFAEIGIDDPCPERWVETTDTDSPRFKVYLTKQTEGLGSERVEFWQVPTLFEPVTEIPIIS